MDAVLAEFQSRDRKETRKLPAGKHLADDNHFLVMVQNVDVRNLDIDHVMRTNLMGEDSSSRTNRPATRQTNLFGPPRDGWVRPPHYVGGGISMATYDGLQQQRRGDGIGVPWLYSRVDALQDPHRWYTFQHADTFEKDVAGYQRIQDSGDVNALALFVAHHPFVTEALLQLTMVLYQTNQSQNGLALLRRTLWIYECAALMSFQPTKSACSFVDHERAANKVFFTALFRLMQVSGMSG